MQSPKYDGATMGTIVILIWPRAQIFPGLTPGPEFKWAWHKWRVDVFLSGATNRGLSYLCGVTEAGFALFHAGSCCVCKNHNQIVYYGDDV